MTSLFSSRCSHPLLFFTVHLLIVMASCSILRSCHCTRLSLCSILKAISCSRKALLSCSRFNEPNSQAPENVLLFSILPFNTYPLGLATSERCKSTQSHNSSQLSVPTILTGCKVVSRRYSCGCLQTSCTSDVYSNVSPTFIGTPCIFAGASSGPFRVHAAERNPIAGSNKRMHMISITQNIECTFMSACART